MSRRTLIALEHNDMFTSEEIADLLVKAIHDDDENALDELCDYIETITCVTTEEGSDG